MNQAYIMGGLIAVIAAWLCVIWYLYKYFSKKNPVYHSYDLDEYKTAARSDLTRLNLQSTISKGSVIDHSSGNSQNQKQASEIIDNAVTQARQTLLDTDVLQKDLVKQVEKNLLEVEENTSRLLESESEALDQQYKDLLSHMQEAIVKARETLVNTEYVRDDFIRELENNLSKVGQELQNDLRKQSEAMTGEYKDMFDDMRKGYLKHSEDTVKAFEKVAEEKIDEFKSQLEEKTIQSEASADKNLTARYQQIAQELEEYRANQMAQIQANSLKILEDVTNRVLGKSINLLTHEQLVLEAIEQAKQDGVIRQVAEKN